MPAANKRAIYTRHIIRGKNGKRRIIYRRAADGEAPPRLGDAAPSPTLTAGDSALAGPNVPFAKRVVASPADFTRTGGARYTTWFRAQGTMGEAPRDEAYARMAAMLDEDIEETPAPAAFYSNQGTILKRVRWPGIKPLDDIIDDLNDKLQFKGEETPDFDFRDIYSRWEYRYQVVETFGGPLAKDRVSYVVIEHRAAHPRRAGWATR